MSFEHLHFFSPRSLKSLLEQVGIRVEHESSLRTMPIRSSPGEGGRQKGLDLMVRMDEFSGHRIRRAYRVWQRSIGRLSYERYAGDVNSNHTLFVLARKAQE